MKKVTILLILNLIFPVLLSGQTRAELEEKRTKTLEEISYVDNMLKNTAKEKSEGINALKILGNKLNLRESVITGMRDEIELLTERIEINQLGIEMMENDLVKLKKDYSNTINNLYKSKKSYPDIVYILSAKDFNQGYKRLKYLQQISKYRRNEAEIIMELKEQIEDTKDRLKKDLDIITDLKEKEETQKNLIQQERTRRQRMIRSLSTKERQLKRDLDEKKRIANEIEEKIARIIAEESKRAKATDMTPEQKLIGENFLENKGRLPWPVERGIITNKFGVHQHPVLKYVTENNFGVEITSSGKTAVRSVYQGEIKSIFAISGANWTVIIRHGNIYTVYNNLVNVKVKTGDKVETKQEIGEVFRNPTGDENCNMKFMIYDEKYLDPEQWIAKM